MVAAGLMLALVQVVVAEPQECISCAATSCITGYRCVQYGTAVSPCPVPVCVPDQCQGCSNQVCPPNSKCVVQQVVCNGAPCCPSATCVPCESLLPECCQTAAPAPPKCSNNDLVCPPHSSYSTCGTYCPPSCDVPEPGACIQVCKSGCFCDPGFVLSHSNSAQCVNIASCQ
eukprot:Hpha_TRINITY_DN2448_c0_g1::TRINITY_DN2448_c0_g1_i1::g.24588::m.24588